MLSLPRDVLEIVVAMVESDKWKPLRLACAQLRDMVDQEVTSLGGRHMVQQGLVSQLIMRLPRLTEVDIEGAKDITDLTPLAACKTLRTLNCGGRQQPRADRRVHIAAFP